MKASTFHTICILPPEALAAQRKIKWLGTGAEIEAPKALRSETPKASRRVGNGEGVSPSTAD